MCNARQGPSYVLRLIRAGCGVRGAGCGVRGADCAVRGH